MRIAFVAYGSLDRDSGGFIYDRALVGALRSIGHEVDVFGLRWHGYFHAVARNVVLGHPLRRPPAPEAPVYDAVIQDELVHPSVFLTNRAATGWPRGRSLLALAHNLRSRQPGEPLAALKARVERRYLETVDGVIAVCARTLADVRALAGGALPGGRDPSRARPRHAGRRRPSDRGAEPRARSPAHPVRGRGEAEQGASPLARCAGAGPAPVAFTLDVVGSLAWPRYARQIRRQLTRFGFEAQVRLHGERTGAELWSLFRQSHVLALPSDREAYPLSCLEALGFGLPVLASSSGGTGEMFDHGREGFLLDPHDTDAWAVPCARSPMTAARCGRWRARPSRATAPTPPGARRPPPPLRLLRARDDAGPLTLTLSPLRGARGLDPRGARGPDSRPIRMSQSRAKNISVGIMMIVAAIVVTSGSRPAPAPRTPASSEGRRRSGSAASASPAPGGRAAPDDGAARGPHGRCSTSRRAASTRAAGAPTTRRRPGPRADQRVHRLVEPRAERGRLSEAPRDDPVEAIADRRRRVQQGRQPAHGPRRGNRREARHQADEQTAQQGEMGGRPEPRACGPSSRRARHNVAPRPARWRATAPGTPPRSGANATRSARKRRDQHGSQPDDDHAAARAVDGGHDARHAHKAAPSRGPFPARE